VLREQVKVVPFLASLCGSCQKTPKTDKTGQKQANYLVEVFLQALYVQAKESPMSRQSNDKLPKYVFRTAFGVIRFKRNIPKDLREVTGKTFFYKVLGKDYKEAMKNYSTALVEFDSFVASYRNEAPVRQTMLELVKNEFGTDAMLQLA
jgi:hypothetical protein